MRYRQDCPPAGLVIKMIFSDKKSSTSTGIRKRKGQTKTTGMLGDNLNAQKVENQEMQKMLDIIDRKPDY